MNDKLLEDEILELNKNFYSKVKAGQILQGKIKSIQPYGVFVELQKDIVGLLHIENISVGRIRHPAERFKVGQSIKVIVKKIDFDTGRIILSHKELLGTWEENIKNFAEGEVVKGIVRDKEKNGIFVELMPNLIGLAEYKFGVSYGDEVEVKIKKILQERHKIKLVILD